MSTIWQPWTEDDITIYNPPLDEYSPGDEWDVFGTPCEVVWGDIGKVVLRPIAESTP